MKTQLANLSEVLNITELARQAGREPKSVRDWVARQHKRLPEQQRPYFARRLDGNAGWLVNLHHPLVEHYLEQSR
jgi:hypothetical protein